MSCIHVEQSLRLIETEHGGPCANASRIASELFNIPIRQIRGRRRHRPIYHARAFAMWAAYQTGLTSYAEIGRYFGDRDHSTVAHACRTAEELMEWRIGFHAMGTQMLKRLGIER